MKLLIYAMIAFSSITSFAATDITESLNFAGSLPWGLDGSTPGNLPAANGIDQCQVTFTPVSGFWGHRMTMTIVNDRQVTSLKFDSDLMQNTLDQTGHFKTEQGVPLSYFGYDSIEISAIKTDTQLVWDISVHHGAMKSIIGGYTNGASARCQILPNFPSQSPLYLEVPAPQVPPLL